MIQFLQLVPYFLVGLVCYIAYKLIMRNLKNVTKNVNKNVTKKNADEVFLGHVKIIASSIFVCIIIFYVSNITTNVVASSVQYKSVNKSVNKIVPFEDKVLTVKDLDSGVTRESINKNTDKLDAMSRIREINKTSKN